MFRILNVATLRYRGLFDLVRRNEESRALTTEINLKNLKSVKKLTMGDETPKKTGSRSSEVPSSLPKPTFMPEPKSFSTKKVIQNYFRIYSKI